MGELGDLLELIHGASARLEGLYAEFWTWRHCERETEASEAYAEDSGAILIHLPTAEAEEAEEAEEALDREPPDRTGLLRVWIDGRERIRVEREGDDGSEITVRSRRRWWQQDDEAGAFTGEYTGQLDPVEVEGLGWLVDPARAIGILQFELCGQGSRAGRNVIIAHARPRAKGRNSWVFDDLGVGADHYQLEVDAERGVILRLEARRAELPFSLVEAATISFDAQIPDELFTIEQGDRARSRSLRDLVGPNMVDIPVETAAQLAPFPLLVPARVPADWHLEVTFVGATQQASQPRVLLWYRSRNMPTSLVVEETSTPDAHSFSEGLDGPPWMMLTRRGHKLLLRGGTEKWPKWQLAFESGPTAITMSSAQLDPEELISLALQLVTVPTGR